MCQKKSFQDLTCVELCWIFHKQLHFFTHLIFQNQFQLIYDIIFKMRLRHGNRQCTEAKIIQHKDS